MLLKTIIFILGLCIPHILFAQFPARGALMDSVKAEFGIPNEISATVGQPPITRWFYESFTVVFEHDHVVHAFPRNISVENLRLKNTDGLVLPSPGTTGSVVNTEPSSAEEATTTQTSTATDNEANTSGNSFFENTPDLIR